MIAPDTTTPQAATGKPADLPDLPLRSRFSLLVPAVALAAVVVFLSLGIRRLGRRLASSCDVAASTHGLRR